MAGKKTWFLAPDFTFFPDGEIGLGSVIPHPSRPTAVLASLLSYPQPSLVLPSVRIHSQSNHSHSAGTERSFNLNLLTNVANVASANTDVETNRHVTRSFGPVDLEVRSFNGSFSPDTIRDILSIPNIKKHVNSSRWGSKRPVYIITGLSVAKSSFHVTEEFSTAQSGSIGASGAVPAIPVPIETGGAMGGGGGKTRSHEYDTAPGVVFSFRCHVVQAKGQTELFASAEGFYTGSGDENEEEEESEIKPVTGDVLKMDLDENVTFSEEDIGDEAWVFFGGREEK